MVRAFNEQEKGTIKDQLIEIGNELFSRLGFKKTSITDIVNQAGIAKGSFYNFYKSKELLLWDVINELEKSIRDQFMSIFTSEHKKEDLISLLLKKMFFIAEEQPLIRQLLDGQLYAQLYRALPPEMLSEHLSEDHDFSITLIRTISGMGITLPGDEKATAAMIRSVFFIAMHKHEIGEDYQQGVDLLCSIIGKSFT